MTESRHHEMLRNMTPKRCLVAAFPCWRKSNSLHGLGMPRSSRLRVSQSRCQFSRARKLMNLDESTERESPWTFRIQIWAVRWKNTTSCRFQPHQACSSAISAMESLSSYETLVVLPKGSEVDDETASRIAHLSAESLSDHGTWFDMCL